MSTIKKGLELMLFIGSKTIGYCTNNTFSLTGNTTDISSKDHGFYQSSEISSFSWEITTENLYTTEDYNSLFDSMISKTELTAVWGTPTNYDAKGLTATGGTVSSWSAPAAGMFTGKVIITSLSTNAANGDNATFSCTFQGHGAISRVANATPNQAQTGDE